ncbi:WD40 repeat domain-containing protein [Streptomyces violaceusniger]|uniref:WD40 repeat domain-containing protein n=1 Tax=Streptomyces violaceusniger TaxID=68280 RepID=UPI0038013E3F
MAEFPDAKNGIEMVAALSVDGKLLLAAGGDEQEPALWDLSTGELLWRTPLNGEYLADIIALDGVLVTAQQYSEEVRLWSPDGTHTVLGEAAVSCLSGARANGRSLILAGGSEVGVWDAATHTHIASFETDDEWATDVTACTLADRTAIVAVTDGGELYAWDLDADPDEPLYEPVTVSQESLETVAVITVGGRLLVAIAVQESLQLWDPADGTKVGHVKTPGYGITVMESTVVDGNQALVTAGDDGVLRIWDESDLT